MNIITRSKVLQTQPLIVVEMHIYTSSKLVWVEMAFKVAKMRDSVMEDQDELYNT